VSIAAAEFKQPACFKWLVETFGPAELTREMKGKKFTPLMYACTSASDEHQQIAKYILEKEPNAIYVHNTISGDTPLHWAILNLAESTVDLLLEKNSDVNLKNNLGETPLMKAAEVGSIPIVKKLIKKGALLWHETKAGDNALKIALKHGYIELATECFMTVGSKNMLSCKATDVFNVKELNELTKRLQSLGFEKGLGILVGICL
jgi:ankyrin repeat protein